MRPRDFEDWGEATEPELCPDCGGLGSWVDAAAVSWAHEPCLGCGGSGLYDEVAAREREDWLIACAEAAAREVA